MDGYTIGWLAWIAWFLVEEAAAILSKSTPNTLSGHAWYWFSIKGKGPWWRLRRFALLAFLAWLSAHLLTGGRF